MVKDPNKSLKNNNISTPSPVPHRILIHKIGLVIYRRYKGSVPIWFP